MHGYVKRNIESQLTKYLRTFPALVILGPRQCGKSTTVKMISDKFDKFVYVDFERPRDLRRVEDLELFFPLNRESVICFDEIQRMPEIFPHLRSLIDVERNATRLIMLGSASPALLRQSSESLAGRVHYAEQTPFLSTEVEIDEPEMLVKLWFRGGFPESYLAEDDDQSILWRESFLKALIERDFPDFGVNVESQLLRRVLTMIAHSQGQVINYSKIAASLNISSVTLKKYVDIFENMFILRTLPPYEINTKKRIVKAPKVYIRDAGLLNALLEIDSFGQLMSHPVYGSSWEGFAIESILGSLRRYSYYFYRTSNGNEIDLVLVRGNRKIGVEFKTGSAPSPGRGFRTVIEDLGLDAVYIVCPVNEIYPVKKNVFISGLNEFIEKLQD